MMLTSFLDTLVEHFANNQLVKCETHLTRVQNAGGIWNMYDRIIRKYF